MSAVETSSAAKCELDETLRGFLSLSEEDELRIDVLVWVCVIGAAWTSYFHPVSFLPDPSCSVCVTSSVFKFRPNFQRLHHFLFWLFSTSRRCFQFSLQPANATQANVFFQFELVCSWNLKSDRKLQFPLQQIAHKRTVSPVKPTLCHPLSVCCVSSEVEFRFHFHLMETCTHQTLY